MQRSHTDLPRSAGIWPKAPALPAIQVLILLAISAVLIFAVDRSLNVSRSRSTTSSAAPISAPGTCPQLAKTFDSKRAACLRRRWSAVREMRPWREAPQDVLFENCLRSSGGEIVMPFRRFTCGNPKPLVQLPSGQN